MTELDPNIVLKAFATPQLDIAGTMQKAADMKRVQMLQQREDDQYSQQQAAQQQVLADQKATRGVIQQYGSDPTGARKAAFATGNPELVKQLDQMDDGARKRTFEISQSTAPLLLSLKNVPPQNVPQAMAAIAPQLQERGFTPEHIAQVQAQLADPTQRDAAFQGILSSAQTIAEYQKAQEGFTLGQDQVRYNANGTELARGPESIKTVTTPEGAITTVLGGAGHTGIGGGPLSTASLTPAIVAQESGGNYAARNPQTGALGAYQVMPATAKSLAERLGLPWRPELMTAQTADGKKYQDAIGQAAVSEAVQASGGDPVKAAMYYHGGSDTGKWGPKTQAYGSAVAQRLGSGGPMIIRGNDKPPKGDAANPAPVGDASKNGEAYLSSLPKTQANQVKALAEGRMAFPSGFALKSPYWQQMIQAVSQYDPSFDAINYNARAKTRADFTAGKSAQNVKALNTAIGHVGQLFDQIDGTASHGGFPGATTINWLENAGRASMGDSGPTKYDQTAAAVASELTQVFRGSGGAEADVKRYLNELSSSGSKEQKQEAVKNILGLLHSRLSAVQDQYTKGMGTSAKPGDILNPHSESVIKRALGGKSAPSVSNW